MSEVNITVLHRAFEKWDMLEAIKLELGDYSTSDDQYMSLTSDSLKLPHLRMFYSDRFNFDYIDTKYLPSLEILVIKHIQQTLTLSFDTISSDTKQLKALSFVSVKEINGTINDNICSLSQLRYFKFVASPLTDRLIIPDCITKLTQLRFFELTVDGIDSTNEDEKKFVNIPSGLYKLPHIQTIAIISWNVNISSFIDFNGYNRDSLKHVWFYASNICQFVNDTSNNNNNSNNSEITVLQSLASKEYSTYGVSNLQDFIDEMDPCFAPCGVNLVYCTPILWGDGVCTDYCNHEECNWDNGDCDQLCEDDCFDNRQEYLFNDECDSVCNTSNCKYDWYNCVPESDEVVCYNDSIGIDHEGDCYYGWSRDRWCDNNCLNHECNWDNSLCADCFGNCKFAQEAIIGSIASISEPAQVITVDELCDSWSLISYV